MFVLHATGLCAGSQPRASNRIVNMPVRIALLEE